MDKRTKAKIFVIAGLALLSVDFGYYLYTQNRVSQQKNIIAEQKEKFLQEDDKVEDEQTDNDHKIVNVTTILQSESQDQSASQNSDGAVNPEIKELFEKAVAYIDIEKINVSLPVFPTTNWKYLKHGTGVVVGTDVPSVEQGSTSVIAGHRGGYSGLETFLNVDKLQKGDLIKITLKDRVLYYAVQTKKVVAATDWSQFYKEKGKNKLILMTCHPYPKNTKRLLIISYLEKVEKI